MKVPHIVFVVAVVSTINGFTVDENFNASSIPTTTTDLTIQMNLAKVNLAPLKQLKLLERLTLNDFGFRVLHSASFSVFPRLKKLILTNGDAKIGQVRQLNLSTGLESLEWLEMYYEPLGDLSTTKFDALPKLNVLKLYVCNVTAFPVIYGLNNLLLYSNPHLDLSSIQFNKFTNLSILKLPKNKANVSIIQTFPMTVRELFVELTQPFATSDFRNLVHLTKLEIDSTVPQNISALKALENLRHVSITYPFNVENIDLYIGECSPNLTELRLNVQGLGGIFSINLIDENSTSCRDKLRIDVWQIGCNCSVYARLVEVLRKGSLQYKCFTPPTPPRDASGVCTVPSTETVTKMTSPPKTTKKSSRANFLPRPMNILVVGVTFFGLFVY